MVPSNVYHVQSLHSIRENQCAELCQGQTQNTNSRCKSFEFVGSRMCMLSNKTVWMTNKYGYESLVKAPGTTYYESSKDYLDLFTRVAGAVFRNDSKYNRLINISSAEECARVCVMTSGFSCNSFAYSHSNRVCALSADFIRSPNDVKKVKNYDTFEYSANWPCNVTLPWRYMPRVIASSRYPFYPKLNQTCVFYLQAPPTKTIVISIQSLLLKSSDCTEPASGVFIYDGDSDQSPLLLGICRHRPELVTSSLKSSSRLLTVKIVTFSKPVIARLNFEYADHDACDGHICQNGASCIPKHQTYRCACAEGFSGPKCEEDIVDNCQSSPCILGKCVDRIGGYTCDCYKGVTGVNCETYLGACTDVSCRHGKCVPLLTGYKCECSLGYTGRNCEYEINECFSNPCLHGHCKDGINNYTCVCDNGFTGRTCQVSKYRTACSGYDCKYGTCAVNESGRYCQCFPGYSGSNCEININECESSPCGLHGHCIDHSHGYTCECSTGYVGVHCNISTSDSCQVNSCIHGYCSVVPPNFDYKCICEKNYTGNNCDVIITPCSSYPCTHGMCIDKGSTYDCKCDVGYSGKNCAMKINFCDNNSCAHGYCRNDITNYTCNCYNGWTGSLCDVKYSPCVNVNCHYGRCMEFQMSFVCICDANHTGSFCDIIKDPCLSSPCGETGTCIPNGSTFVCYCDSKRTGQFCESTINPCSSSPCAKEATETSPEATTETHNKRVSTVVHEITTKGTTRASTAEMIHALTTEQTTLSTTELQQPPSTQPHVSLQTKETPRSTAPVISHFNPCVDTLCINGRCELVNGIATCRCYEQYAGDTCDLLKVKPDKPPVTNVTPNSLTFPNTSLCSNVSCVYGACLVFNSKPICVCNSAYTGKLCDVSITKNAHSSLNNIHSKRHNESNTCDNETCINGRCIKQDGSVTCRCNQNYTGKDCKAKLEVGGNGNTTQINNNTVKFEEDKHPYVKKKCNTTSCVHGECLLKNDHYKCHCHEGFKGKFCNTSVHTVDNATSKDRDNPVRSVEYAAIIALCVCLLILIVAGGVLWFRKAKSGSLYITNPSDFAAKDREEGPSEKDIKKKGDFRLKKSSLQQQEPGRRCAWYLSSGTSDCSDDSRHGNKYDDVNISARQHEIPAKTTAVAKTNTCLDTERKPPVNTGMQSLGTDLQTARGQRTNCDTGGLTRPITIRLPDKRFRRCPGFQTIAGVQKGKSDV